MVNMGMFILYVLVGHPGWSVVEVFVMWVNSVPCGGFPCWCVIQFGGVVFNNDHKDGFRVSLGVWVRVSACDV